MWWLTIWVNVRTAVVPPSIFIMSSTIINPSVIVIITCRKFLPIQRLGYNRVSGSDASKSSDG